MTDQNPIPSTLKGEMTVLDLFSGIGGFSLGLERAGMKTVAFCEISPKCRHLLATHWPDVPRFEDVTTLTGEQVGSVNVICGGFPCQDISFAGKGAGLAGERSGLWRHYARLIGELRPDYVIVENVAALLGRGLGDVLGDLAALGYDAWWDCIPAAAVGAPHRRDRLWLVAYPRGVEHQGYGDALRREIASELSRASLGHDANRQQQGTVGQVCSRQDAVSCRGGDVAHAAGERRGEARALRRRQSEERTSSGGQAIAVADPSRIRRSETVGHEQGQGRGWARTGQSAGDRQASGGQWSAEPNVGRVAHGVPARVDRLHGLGNAVVPQIPEILGRAILSARSALQHSEAMSETEMKTDMVLADRAPAVSGCATENVGQMLTMLEDVRSMLRIIGDDLEDEGDRIYLASTNHADWLRDLGQRVESFLIATGAA